MYGPPCEKKKARSKRRACGYRWSEENNQSLVYPDQGEWLRDEKRNQLLQHSTH
jgi:hypothetical protein